MELLSTLVLNFLSYGKKKIALWSEIFFNISKIKNHRGFLNYMNVCNLTYSLTSQTAPSSLGKRGMGGWGCLSTPAKPAALTPLHTPNTHLGWLLYHTGFREGSPRTFYDQFKYQEKQDLKVKPDIALTISLAFSSKVFSEW